MLLKGLLNLFECRLLLLDLLLKGPSNCSLLTVPLGAERTEFLPGVRLGCDTSLVCVSEDLGVIPCWSSVTAVVLPCLPPRPLDLCSVLPFRL